jgi:anaerobic selenocysteine-containing dehydrogenase
MSWASATTRAPPRVGVRRKPSQMPSVARTTGIDELLANLDATSWDEIEEASGLSRSDIEFVGNIYAKAKRVIINYGVGITQHRHGTGDVQQIANLLMLRGNIGRQGAGISPLRGHSNVQGDRTVGITEIPSDELLNAIARVFGFGPPRHKATTRSRSRPTIQRRLTNAKSGSTPALLHHPSPGHEMSDQCSRP